MPTRERVWRANLSAYDEGHGPDPLAVHCLTKHGRRFKPGGLASQARGLVDRSPGFGTFAIANARLCTVNNGFPNVRMLPPMVLGEQGGPARGAPYFGR